MYTHIALKQLPRPDITVVADTAMAHTITLLAKVLQARNPLITAPPITSQVFKAAGDVKSIEQLTDTLQYAINNPFFLRIGGKTEDGSPTADKQFQPWLVSIANLGLSGLLSFPRVYLSDVPYAADALRTLTSEQNTHLGSFLGMDLDKLITEDPIRIPFTQLALTMAYEEIVRKGLFDKIAPPDNTGERAQYTFTERGLLMNTLLRVLAIQTTLLRIRPVLRYLRMEQSRIRIREEMIPAQAEYWENVIDRILALPVHPWIARAEQTALPANRMTPWGDSTPSILIERTFLNSPWNGEGEPSSQERAKYATEMSKRLDAAALLGTCEGLLRDMRQWMDDIEQGGRFQKITSTLGFTTPGGPIPVPMWSTAYKVLHMDGLNANESITDLIAASFQIHLPAQGGVTSPWIGEEQIVNYTGMARIDGRPSPWSEYQGTIATAPEDIVMDANYYTARFTPAMLQRRKQGFKGDLNAVTVPATVDGVRNLLGRTVEELAAMVIAAPDKWSHIFEVIREGGGGPTAIKPVDPTEALFYSDRTQMTWLTNIDLPRRGVPSMMWAVRRGKPENVMPTRARFLRDAVVPLPSVPMASAIDKLQRDAVAVTLTGIKK